MTNFWEHVDREREIREGKLMVDCAMAVSPKLLLISSLPSVAEATQGRLVNVHHYEAQAAIPVYARELKVPYTEVQPVPYMNNFTTFMRPQPAGDGTYVIRDTWSPETKLPLIDCAHDYGNFVRLAIESPAYNKGDGKVVMAYAEWLSLADQATIMSEVTGRHIKYEKISQDAFRAAMAGAGAPSHVQDDMVEMEEFQELGWPNAFTHMDLSQLSRQPRSFREYCEHEDWKATGLFSDM
jgi:uncharacterized protein YbjT (DUF2867 family)